MANRAIVIGVEKYETARFNLPGTINDAMDMVNWLVTGGRVPPGNIALLISPIDVSTMPQVAGVIPLPGNARAKDINKAVKEIAGKAAEKDDKLYFYFSGHGITAPSDLIQEAILPADFSEDDPTAALGIQSIFQWFKTSQFNQQFFFIDGCRNLPFSQRFPIGGFSTIPPISALRPEVEQYVFMATSRGLEAVEAEKLDGTRGAVFTQALVGGLQGKGAAKQFNVLSGNYEVTPDSLLRYVTKEVQRQISELIAMKKLPDTVSALLRVPTLSGEHQGDPVPIVSFDPNAIEDVLVDLAITPGEAVTGLTVQINGLPTPAEPARSLEAPQARIKLAPGLYKFSAKAERFSPEKPRGWPLELFEHSSLTITLVPEATPQPDRSPEPTPGSLLVNGPDDYALLKVWDQSRQQVLATGAGVVQLNDLSPGLYRATVVQPEAQAGDVVVAVTAGQQTTATLAPPPSPPDPRLDQFVAALGLRKLPDNTLSIDEASRLTISVPKVSTLLSIATAVPGVPSLDKLGLKKPQITPESSAFHAAFADEFQSAAPNPPTGLYGNTTQLALWPLDQPVAEPSHMQPVRPFPTVAEYLVAAQPGSYWCQIITNPETIVLIPLTLLAGRVLDFICTRSNTRKASIFLFHPSHVDTAPSAIKARILLDLAQRFLVAGQSNEALRLLAATAPEIAASDPIFGFLTGYLALQTVQSGLLDNKALKQNRDLLDAVHAGLVKECSAAPDTHVIGAAIFLLDGKKEEAANSMQQALILGLPTCQAGCRELLRMIGLLNAGHPRIALLARLAPSLVPGMIWSAFAVPCPPVGRVLV